MTNRKYRNPMLLFLAAGIWGMAFVSQSKGMEYMQPLTFNGVRALIGVATLLVYLAVTGRFAKGKITPEQWKKNLIAGVCCGLALTAASALQQFGIKYTTVAKAGFITTLYIIFVPLLGLFLRRKVFASIWVAVVMAAAGMYLLCMTESLVLSVGDVLVFLCAIAYAVQIMLVDHFAPETDGPVVSCIQFLVCGIVCTLGAFIWEAPKMSQLTSGIGALLYAGVLSCGVAFTLQIVGQNGVNPTIAALIMSLESVIASVAGWVAFRIGFLTDDQTLTGTQIAGCAIVFAAVVLVQLPGGWLKSIKKKLCNH